jgi:multidrug efflux system membrane fusion protein
VTSIPTPAIQRGPQGTYVYVVQKDNTVKIQPVTVALTSSNSTGIASGLQPGDVVVTDGTDKLQDGSKVEAHTATGGSTTNAQGAPGQAAPNPQTMAPGQAPSHGAPSASQPGQEPAHRGKRQ